MKLLCAYSACVSATDLRWKYSLIMKESLTERLLMVLVDIRKPQDLFFVSWCKVQEGLIACEEVFILTCDQQHTVPVEKLESFWLLKQPKCSDQSDKEYRANILGFSKTKLAWKVHDSLRSHAAVQMWRWWVTLDVVLQGWHCDQSVAGSLLMFVLASALQAWNLNRTEPSG